TPQTYKDSDFKQYWMPDSSCRECYDCGDKFTTFRRRHHCRICGQIFCSKCCNQELPGKIIGYKGGIRVCTYCCRVVQRYASTGDYKGLEDLRAFSQLCNDSGSFDFGRRSISPKLSLGMEDVTSQIRVDSLPDLQGMITSDMHTPFDLTPQSEFSSQENLLLESKLLIQDSVQLRELWRQVCDIEAGVEIQTMRVRLRTHQNCIVGKELVDWLIKRDKAASRDQALAIGQALLYAGYLDCVGHQSIIFKDDFTLYRPGETASALDILGQPETMSTITEEMEKNEPLWFQEIGRTGDDGVDGPNLTHSSPSDDHHSTMVDSEGQKSNSSESDSKTLFYTNETSRSGSFSEMPKIMTMISRDIIDEPLPRQDSSVHGLGDEFLKGALFLRNPPVPSSDLVTCPHGWRSVDQLREENGEKLAYERLKRAHSGLWHALTRQMLSEQCLLSSWEMIIYSCITQISHFVHPDVRLEGDDMDIRNYVHIKKVPGGNKSDTSLFHGVIFTKNVAHKKMKTKIANPLILLLKGTIEFQRVENKFSSLEPQILQEREFMRNCVMKMVAYRPNVVVVEKSVSRLAQEYLLEAGITLLYNVKPSVMERLARFTQADIVPSIDGLVSKPNMGFCHDFRLQTFTLPNKETKTLAVFDGCATHLGCTIVLRGGTPSELRRVKYILKFMTYTAYNSLLELCFCMDEFAMPQPGADELEQPFEGLESSTELSLDDTYRNDNTEKANWDGSPRLIGSIMCIIPKSSLPIIVGGPSQIDVESCAEADRNDCKNVCDSAVSEQLEGDGTEICLPEDNVFSSSDANVDTGSETHATDVVEGEMQMITAVKPSPGDENLATTNTTNTLNLPDRCGILSFQSRPSTSILTELTDFSDPLLGYQNTHDESIFNSASAQKIALKEIKQTNYKRFRKALDGVHLSVSPYHKYSVPFIETDKGSRCPVRKYLPEEIYWSKLFDGEENQWQIKSKTTDVEALAKVASKNNIQILDPHSLITCKLTEPIWDSNTQTLLADFRARGGRIQLDEDTGRQSQVDAGSKKVDDSQGFDPSISGLLWEKKIDCLDPTNHQKLMVLFSSYSYKSANHPYPCVYPWVVTMEFYGRNDITLGGFLEKFCFRKQYSCPSATCDTPMTDHVRRFVHGNACINVLLKNLDNEVPGGKENILMWSWCRKCKQVTPVVPISGDTWSLSFAKYLDLRFHSSSFQRRGAAEPCPHSLHHDHFQYFGHRNIVASFNITIVLLEQLVLPLYYWNNLATDRYSLMLENTMKLKQELTSDTHIRAISEILLEQQNDKKSFRDAATNIQMKINCDMTFHLYAIFDNIELLKRKICEDVSKWNTRMQEFMLLQQKKPRAQASSKKDKDVGQSATEEATASILSQASNVNSTSEDLSNGKSVVTTSPVVTVIIPELQVTDASPASLAVPTSASASKETTPAVEGSEETAEGWFQDLKGATRRWLSTSSFTPLPLPFDPCEHHTLQMCERVPVAVYDPEPSSIIAYAL
ncbi:unnamed protein product, partial [Candidula unifasciata]